MTTVEISVTAEHIAQGVRNDCGQCPVALALREIYPDNPAVDVGNGCAIVGYLSRRLILSLPPEAGAFIEGFDLAGVGEPFTFTATVAMEVAA